MHLNAAARFYDGPICVWMAGDPYRRTNVKRLLFAVVVVVLAWNGGSGTNSIMTNYAVQLGLEEKDR